jgi:hypothetical protein
MGRLTVEASRLYKRDLMSLILKRVSSKSRLGSPRKGRPAMAVARAGGEL